MTSTAISPIKVALVAQSQQIVDDFYLEALKAGGSSQAHPADREDESPYYSAVVADFDGNCIEAMYRQDITRMPNGSLRSSDTQRIASWQKEIASVANGRASRYDKSVSPRIIVNNITTTPSVEVRRMKPESNEDGEISTRAIIGTLLGASAGAAVAYAITRSESPNPHRPEQPNTRAIEAPPRRVTEIIFDPAKTAPPSSHRIELIDREVNDNSAHRIDSGSRVKTVASSHLSKEEAAVASAKGSHTGRTIAQTNGTKVLTGNTEKGSLHSHKSRATTIKVASTHPSHVTQKTSSKSAKDVPLPPSSVSKSLTPATNNESPLNDLATIVPDDSISQVSTRVSSKHHKRPEQSHHHHHSKSSHGSKKTKGSEHGSSRTVKALERHSKTPSSHRR